MTTITRGTLALALIAAVALGAQSSASASERGFRTGANGSRVNLAVARQVVHVARPVAARRWIADSREYRTESVRVATAHNERVWTPAAYEYRSSRPGTSVRVLRPGYWREVYVPARYETRTVSVLVPGHWENTTMARCSEVAVTASCGVSHGVVREHRR